MRLDVESVSFSYGENEVLRDVSFSVKEGDVISLLGPNGTGKSTLFRCILGFLEPSEGCVKIDGRDVKNLSVREKALSVAYIPQSFNPVFNHSVLESVVMGSVNRISLFSSPGREEREKAMEILSSVGLGDKAGSGTRRISGGERQLMLIARALMQNARLIVMDEPTASLDYANTHKVMRMTASLADRGYAVIFSTHSPSLALLYSKRVIALKNGSVLSSGASEEVMTSDMLSSLYSFPILTAEVSAGGKKHIVCLPGEEDNGQT